MIDNTKLQNMQKHINFKGSKIGSQCTWSFDFILLKHNPKTVNDIRLHFLNVELFTRCSILIYWKEKRMF